MLSGQVGGKMTGTIPHGRRYPWDEWLHKDKAVQVKRGVDFKCSLYGFVVTARKAASKMGYGLMVRIDSDENTVTMKLRVNKISTSPRGHMVASPVR